MKKVIRKNVLADNEVFHDELNQDHFFLLTLPDTGKTFFLQKNSETDTWSWDDLGARKNFGGNAVTFEDAIELGLKFGNIEVFQSRVGILGHMYKLTQENFKKAKLDENLQSTEDSDDDGNANPDADSDGRSWS